MVEGPDHQPDQKDPNHHPKNDEDIQLTVALHTLNIN